MVVAGKGMSYLYCVCRIDRVRDIHIHVTGKYYNLYIIINCHDDALRRNYYHGRLFCLANIPMDQ